ncbi:hypothetical protein SCARR_02649 [Pontiella sulfatireligans]|uniref:Uncharacterized protein n=1 Tax=Pontiella sulfatireligans TaxID=2750658 RepID=A0A6C2UMP7_9BACT|nr:hypothetical protein SCARR_02649 [Pontiella sulfatireligans]
MCCSLVPVHFAYIRLLYVSPRICFKLPSPQLYRLKLCSLLP